jgi:GNAT superfamily N-acetyltransferase
MPSSITIRPASAVDATSIATLLGQLGYPSSAEDAVARLARLEAFSDATALVAELDGHVIGLVTCHVFPSIHAPALVAWVTTLVVDEQHLQKGAGRRLTGAVEQWARERGAVRISVTSGKHRDGAHAFYESIGYELTGVRLSKALG